MLSTDRRSQLDGIVQKMVANKEDDATVQFVVNDFKKKYESENATKKMGGFDTLSNLASAGKSALTSAASLIPGVGTAIQGASNLGAAALANPDSLPSAGAIVGGIAGGASGAGFGSIATGALGAAGGHALGTEMRDAIQGRQTDYVETAKGAAGAAALQATGDGFFAGVAKLGRAISPSVAPLVGKLTGYGNSLMETAMQRSPQTVEAVKRGEQVLNENVKRTAVNLSSHAKEVFQSAKETVKMLSGSSGGGKGYPGTRQAILDEGTNFIDGITRSLRSEHNIGVSKTGALDFNRSTLPSNIVSGSDGKTIQDGYNLLKSITKDTTISNIDAVLERFMVLKSKTPAGTPTGAQTKAIIGDMMEKVQGFVKSLGGISPAYEQYAQFLEHNLPQRVFINEAKDLFGATQHIGAEDIASLTKKTLAAFSSGNSAVKGFMEKIGATVGTDPVGAAAGSHINSDQFSVRAPSLVNRSIIAKVAESLPRSLIKNYVATGNLLGLETHPLLQKAANILGITTKAAAQILIDIITPKSEPTIQGQQDNNSTIVADTIKGIPGELMHPSEGSLLKTVQNFGDSLGGTPKAQDMAMSFGVGGTAKAVGKAIGTPIQQAAERFVAARPPYGLLKDMERYITLKRDGILPRGEKNASSFEANLRDALTKFGANVSEMSEKSLIAHFEAILNVAEHYKYKHD